jgi:hypothetical protein
MNEGAKNKGSKTASEDKVGKNLNKPVTGAAAILDLRRQVRALAQEIRAAKQENVELRRKLGTVKRQVSAHAEEQGRRSISASSEVVGLLQKSGIDAVELRASGQRLSPSDVDAIFASAGVQLDPVKRMELKNRFLEAGLMEEGHVNRGFSIGR